MVLSVYKNGGRKKNMEEGLNQLETRVTRVAASIAGTWGYAFEVDEVAQEMWLSILEHSQQDAAFLDQSPSFIVTRASWDARNNLRRFVHSGGENLDDLWGWARVRTGSLLRHLRKQRGWTLRELADKLGVSPTKLGNMEQGAFATLPPELTARLCAVLEVTGDELRRGLPLADSAALEVGEYPAPRQDNPEARVIGMMTLWDRLAELPDRARQVAELLGLGFSRSEIAQELGISRSMVTKHVARVRAPAA